MPIIYIGRQTTYKGKSLWEILGNLKNHGVGRMVIRSSFERYPETSYMKILKVAALPNTSTNPHDARKVIALVERTFRGKTCSKPVQIDSASYKADYVLIPKDQEARYSNVTVRTDDEKLFPGTAEFPPLLTEVLNRQAKEAGHKFPLEQPKLNIRYNRTGSCKKYRIAGENETPTEKFHANLDPRLYLSNVKVENPS